MRVMITGAQGQIGQALLRDTPLGFEVHGLARASLDIAHEDAVRATVARIQPDAILNAAAYTAVDRAESEAVPCHNVNEHGAGFLATSARECGARLVHISTDFVFDGTASIPYSPDSVPRPINVYGESKWRGEQAVLGILGDRAVILRTAWVYSARGNNFVCKMLRLMREQGEVNVVADQFGTPTAAHSVARALWELVRRTDLGGIHHWTDAGVASWYDFAVAIAEEASALELLPADVVVRPIRTEDFPTPARRPRFGVLDKRSTSIALGLQPRHWRDNLRETLKEIARA